MVSSHLNQSFVKVFFEQKVIFLLDSPENDKCFLQTQNNQYFFLLNYLINKRNELSQKMMTKDMD